MDRPSLFDLTSKVALVTGGSRGFGLEMALTLGDASAAMAITARRTSWLDAAEQDLPARGIDCLAATCDVADVAQVDATVTAIKRASAVSTCS